MRRRADRHSPYAHQYMPKLCSPSDPRLIRLVIMVINITVLMSLDCKLILATMLKWRDLKGHKKKESDLEQIS